MTSIPLTSLQKEASFEMMLPLHTRKERGLWKSNWGVHSELHFHFKYDGENKI